MGKKSRRKRTKRNNANCSLCNESIQGVSCTQCQKGLCFKCTRNIMNFCPGETHESGEQVELFYINCPFCRLKIMLGDATGFVVGVPSVLKNIVATADSHVIQVAAKCCGNPTAILRHLPSKRLGRYNCDGSCIQIIAYCD